MTGVGKVTLTNADLRENFRVAAMMIAHANGVYVSKIDLDQLVQGYVQSFVDARPNYAQIQWPITNTDLTLVGAPNIPLMRIVNQVDSFCAGKLGYYLMIYAFSGGLQTQPSYTTGFRMMPITYPSWYANAVSILGSTYIGLDPGCIIFWHGYIAIEVNGIKLYKNWECQQHLYVPRGQSTPTLNAALPPTGGGAGNPFAVTTPPAGGALPFWQPNQYDQYDGGQDAFYPLEPLPVFSGSKQSIVTLNLPANIPGTIAPFTDSGYGTEYILKIVLHLRGVLAQNSTSMK